MLDHTSWDLLSIKLEPSLAAGMVTKRWHISKGFFELVRPMVAKPQCSLNPKPQTLNLKHNSKT